MNGCKASNTDTATSKKKITKSKLTTSKKTNTELESFSKQLKSMSSDQIAKLTDKNKKLIPIEFKRRHYLKVVKLTSEAILAEEQQKEIDRKFIAQMYVWRGKAKLTSIDFDSKEALADCRKALKYDDNVVGGYEVIGTYLDAEGKYQEAIDAFTKGIERRPKFRTLYSHRAGVYQQIGEFQKAIDDFSKNIELSPPYSWYGRLSRAKLYQRVGESEKALADYTKTIEKVKDKKKKNPLVDTLKLRALYLIELSRTKEAINDLNWIIKIDKYSNDAYRLRATQYEKLGKDELALKDYSNAIRLNPHFCRASLESRARLYTKSGKVDLADKDIKRARKIEKKPAISPVYDFKKKSR